MSTQLELHQRGHDLLEQLHGGHAGEAMVAELLQVAPDFADMTIDWAIGGVMARPGLDLPTRELILVAACVTLGYAMPQLRAHTEAALKVGATKKQVIPNDLLLRCANLEGGLSMGAQLRHGVTKSHTGRHQDEFAGG